MCVESRKCSTKFVLKFFMQERNKQKQEKNNTTNNQKLTENTIDFISFGLNNTSERKILSSSHVESLVTIYEIQ